MPKKCAKDGETNLPKHLEKRADGRSPNYYVRLVAPRAIQPFLSKKDIEFRVSTGTANLREAKVIAADLVARKTREWDAHYKAMQPNQRPRHTPLTESLIKQIAGARMQSWLATDYRERVTDGGVDNETLAEMDAFCARSETAMRSILAQGARSDNWPSVVEDILDWCETLEYSIDVTDSQFPLLVRAYANAERDAQKYVYARNMGEEPQIKDVELLVGTTLSAMTAQYSNHKSKNVGQKTLSKNISIWERLVKFRGDAFLDDVTSGDIYRFFEDRLYSADKPWSQGYVDGHAKRALTEIFKLARTLNLMTGVNPASALEMVPKLSDKERKSRLRPRYAFSSEKLNILFSSQWYDPDSRLFRGKLAKDLAVRYFAPLIGLLHGTRVRESLQLVTNDLVDEGGLLCVKFQIELDSDEHDDQTSTPKKLQSQSKDVKFPTRTLKNESAFRTIPVHPKLLELGFKEYVDSRRDKNGLDVPLFESALPDPGGKTPLWGRAYEQAFLRFVLLEIA